MRAYPGFGRRRSPPEESDSRSASADRIERAPADAPVDSTRRTRWGKRLKVFGCFVVFAFAYDEFKLAYARQSASDVSPGLRLASERYQTPKGCPGSTWNEGQRMPRACLRGYDIFYQETWSYGLAPPAGGWRSRQDWFRAGDDAVLAYCGLLVGCKATLVVRNRFYDAWEPRT